MPVILEPAKTLEVARSADVVVCGGGVAAALSSARSGAKTILIEKNAPWAGWPPWG